MASIALRHKSRNLILKSHPTLFNLSRLYSSSSSDNDDDGNHQQQSSNPAPINEEIPKNLSPNNPNPNPNPNPNSDFNHLMGDTFRESMQKLKEKNVDNNVNQQFTLTNYMESLSTNKSIGNTNPNRRRVMSRSPELGNDLKELRPEISGKFKEIEKEKETMKSDTVMGGGLNFEELRKSIDSIRLKLKDEPRRK